MLTTLPLVLLLFGPAVFMLWLALRQLQLTAAAVGAPREALVPSWLRQVLGRAIAAVLVALLLIIALAVVLRQPAVTRAAWGLPWVFAVALGIYLPAWQRRWIGPGQGG